MLRQHAPEERTASPGRPALLIIDMQNGMAPARTGPRNNPGAEDRIASLLAAWREAGAPVVHVHHLSRTPGSPFAPGQDGVDVQPRFRPVAGEHRVEKKVPDAFSRSALEQWLGEHGIERLVVVGVSTNNSVEATVRSAGNLGFSVLVVADATFTFDQADYNGVARSAEEVHAMSLANLDGEYAAVVSTDRALAWL